MRQCFRTAYREAFSRAQPGYLQTNRCVLPVTKILPSSPLQQSRSSPPAGPSSDGGASRSASARLPSHPPASARHPSC
jgi:hypothetical protein